MRGVTRFCGTGYGNIHWLFGPCPELIKAEEQRGDAAGPCVARAGSVKRQRADPGDSNGSKELAPAR